MLDLASLEVFWLPIDSERAAVGGFDAATQTCVSVIFDDSNNGEDPMAEHCAFEPLNQFLCVVITPDAAPCVGWDHVGEATVVAASGCSQLIDLDPLTMAIDVTIEVGDGPFPGSITVASRSRAVADGAGGPLTATPRTRRLTRCPCRRS